MKITTESGFSCNVNEETIGDWETAEKLIDVQKGEIRYLPEVMKDMLGEDGYAAAKDFVRNDKGRVRTEDLMKLFQEVMVATGEKSSKKK